MHPIGYRTAHTLDRLIGRLGMYLSYQPEWPSPRLSAWHDSDGALTLQIWRFELEFDWGLPKLLRRRAG